MRRACGQCERITCILASAAILLSSCSPRATATPVPTATPLSPPPTSQPLSAATDVAVGEWFAVVSADYAGGEVVVRSTADTGGDSSWIVYLVSTTELCGIVATTNGSLATCRPKGGEQRMITAEQGQLLQLDPYSVEVVATLTIKIGNLMPQTDGSKKVNLANADMDRLASILIYSGNKVTISYSDVS